MNKKNIVHLTSAHPRYDVRIFIKMCSSLSSEFDVTLIVADGLGDERKNNVSIVDAGPKTGGRISRMTKTVSKVYQKAKKLNGDIYHMHDPELIPIGLKLKRLGKVVIFDAHEDLPKQILGKPYLNKWSKIILSKVVALYERRVCQKFDAVIAATPVITQKFVQINRVAVNINNFPLMNELESEGRNKANQRKVAYVGGITQLRGIEYLVRAMALTNDVSLNLVGGFSGQALESYVKGLPGFDQVDERGYLDRKDVKNVLAESCAGIVTFLSSPNHVDAQPNKMFEYMSASLPIITSDFPLWKEIVEGNNCGICVDPESSDQIAKAIQYLVDNPQEARVLGANGRKAVVKTYNWGQEEKKLLALYRKLLN